jgi:uncharacterized protein (DUF111 family)
VLAAADGAGLRQARHGILPLPPPAVVECLHGVPTYAVELDAELVTPTGAAIVAAAASRFERWPSFAPERVGFGAGRASCPIGPTCCAWCSDPCPRLPEVGSASTHVVLEANVDDLTGELAAHAIEALFAAGALDAWATPITMKKGRPGADHRRARRGPSADAVAAALLQETSTIGVRARP